MRNSLGCTFGKLQQRQIYRCGAAILFSLWFFPCQALYSQDLVARAREEKNSFSITAPALTTPSQSSSGFANAIHFSRWRITDYPA